MNEAREWLIKKYQIKNHESEYFFYYDETNNIGKLYISEKDKLNVNQLNNFVLGGVLLESNECAIDFETLKNMLNLQKSTKELKLKHICQGNFLDIADSPKLTIFLEWLEKNNLFIHFIHIDLFFFSVVDIIDSILIYLDDFQVHHNILKADFYELIKPDRDLLIQIFSKYNYPNITRSDKSSFLGELLTLIEKNKKAINHFKYQNIKGLIQFSLHQEDLPFLTGSTSKELINNFFPFYFSNILMFKNSHHIFDENAQIQKIFKDKEITSNRKVFFKTSHQVPLIQISDIFSGLMGKLYSYITYSTEEEILKAEKLSSPVSIRNLALIEHLISKSEEISKGLINHVASQHDRKKSEILFWRSRAND